MIKLVAFDLDGTIADTIPMCIEAFKQAVSPYASKILSKDDIVKTFGLNEEGMIKEVVSEDWEKALVDFYVIYKEMHTTCLQPFMGIRELITELKENSIIVSLITGKGVVILRFTILKWKLFLIVFRLGRQIEILRQNQWRN